MACTRTSLPVLLFILFPTQVEPVKVDSVLSTDRGRSLAMYSPLERMSRASYRKAVLIAIVVCTCLVLLSTTPGWFSYPSFDVRYGKTNAKPEQRAKRRHVVVASHFRQHFDVHLAAAHTIRQVLGDDGSVEVFANTPLLHGFQDVVGALGLYDKQIRHPDEFINAMKSSTTSSLGDPGDMVDLVLFGTCEIDMNRWSDELLAVWDSRPADQKFRVVCIVHHFRDTNWQRHITPWASRGAIRLLPIGYHVGRAFRAHFQEVADSTDPELYTALYEYIDIDVHAPVLGLPEYNTRRQPGVLSRAVIQGNFQVDRRDYPHIFADLLEALQNDPVVWGYQPLGHGRDAYERIPGPSSEPFELHLIGEGHLDIPKELSNVVFIHNGLTYFDFYALMQSMDVVIPAFVNKDYYDFQASSTVVMAVQCNVPILASRRMRNAYGYIDDDRVTIVRPQALREIPAIGALRGAAWNLTTASDASNVQGFGVEKYEEDVRHMLSGDWRRTSSGFTQFKSELWMRNKEAVWRILNDLPGEI